MADNLTIFDNSATTQRTIAPSFNTQTFTNTTTDLSYSLDPGDTNDFYRLRLTQRSSLILSLQPGQDNADLALLDYTGNPTAGLLYQSTNGGTLTDAIATDLLDPGDYYIRVFTPDASVTTSYSLNVATIPTRRTDLLWRNSITGQNATWLMDGVNIGATSFANSVGDPNWQIRASGDMNGDGSPDYIWRNAATGQNAVWLMGGSQGTTLLSGILLPSVVGSEWSIEGAGDFNRDGSADLVWRNYRTGENAFWFMNGTAIQSAVFFTPIADPAWRMNAVADFDGDGNLDLVWRNYTTGQHSLWLMNGATLLNGIASFVPSIPDPNWAIVGAGDVTGDAQPDLILRNLSTGQNAAWQMNGVNFVSGLFLTTINDPNWRIATTVNSLPIADLASNTLGSGFNIGTLNSGGVYSDTIGTGVDPDDYYRFTLSSGGFVNLSLSGLTADVDLQLLRDINGNGIIDSASEILATSATAGNVDERITSFSLNAGTYFIRVYSAATLRTAYSLGVSAIAAQQIDLQVSSFSITNTSGAAFTTALTLGNPPTNNTLPPTIRINYGVRNVSGNSPSSFRIAFYLSRDNVINSSDRRFGTVDANGVSDRDVIITNLASNTTQTGNRDLTLPLASDNWWGGDQIYYIGMIVDDGAQVIETNENNNVGVGSVNIRGTIRPDVLGGGLTLNQSTSSPGQTITASFRVRNTGTVSTTSSSFTIIFYISQDNFIDPGQDDPVGIVVTTPSNSVIAANGGFVDYTNISLTLPPISGSWPGWRGNGRYYIGAWIDIRQVINEGQGRENNLNYGRVVGQFLDYNFIDITGF